MSDTGRAKLESYEHSGLAHRLVRRSAATRAGAKIFGAIQQPLDQLVYRLSRGTGTATSWLSGVSISMLTTTGAKTGRARTVPVLGLPDGENVILIASNFGRPNNPAWYHNLRAHPRATVVFQGVRREMTARELSGAEREAGLQRATQIHPGFANYQRWAAKRTLPVLLLEPLR